MKVNYPEAFKRLNIINLENHIKGSYCGILSDLTKRVIPPGLPQCHLYTASIGHSFRRDNDSQDGYVYSQRLTSAAGAGVSREYAMRCAIGEAIERYCATMLDYTRTKFAHQNEFNGECVNPSDWIDYDSKVASEKQSWLLGHKIENGRPIWVPVSTTWLFNGANPDLKPLIQINSNGLSAGLSRDKAIIGGLCELLERDALMVNWQIKQPLKRIIVDDGLLNQIHPLFHEYLNGAHDDVKIDLYNMQFEAPIPIVLARLTLINRPFGMILGASAKFDIKSAIEKALLECVSVFYASGIQFLEARRPVPKPREVKNFLDHGLYYADPGNCSKASFLFGEGETTLRIESSETSDSEHIARITSYLNGLDITPYFVDLTTTDARAFGFWVVRCLAPGLEPIRCGLPAKNKDLRRLTQVADRRGLDRWQYNNTLQPFA